MGLRIRSLTTSTLHIPVENPHLDRWGFSRPAPAQGPVVAAEVVVVEAGTVVEVTVGVDVEVVEPLTGPVVLVLAEPPGWVGGAVVVGVRGEDDRVALVA